MFVASEDRILPLLAHRVAAVGRRADLAVDTNSVLQQSIREQAALELNLRPELTAVAEAFHCAAIRVLLLKGAALAYTDYAAPFLRPRGDTDVLVALADRARARTLLLSLGYVERLALATERVSQQAQYSRVLRTGVEHTIDLHWRTFNPEAFARLLTFDEMWNGRRPVPPLGPAAFAPGRVHALLLSLLHRIAHHEPSSDLLWLYDVHLGARALTAGEWDAFFDVAARHDVSVICAQGLDGARSFFATRLPEIVVAWMAERLREPVPGRFRAFQRPGRRVIDMFVSDFRSASTWRGRVRLVREHLLPPREYMRARYGHHRDSMLPLLYVHRAAAGVRRWLQRDLFR